MEPVTEASPLRSLSEAIAFVDERHQYWCREAATRTYAIADACKGRGLRTLETAFGPEPLRHPQAMVPIYARGEGSAHYVRATETCFYFLPYAMHEPDYDRTIAHEVTHHYTHRVWPLADDHGEIFDWFMAAVLGQHEPRHGHRYNVPRALNYKPPHPRNIPHPIAWDTKFGTAIVVR